MYRINGITFNTNSEVDAFLLTATYVHASGCTSLTKLSAPMAIYVDARGCTGLTKLSAPKATHVYARGCTSLTKLSALKATEVDARGCTSLTKLSALKATEVDARGCTGLTKLSAPKATEVYASGCTSLTKLSAPMAIYVDARGCTSLIKCNGFKPLSKSKQAANLKKVAELALASNDALKMSQVHVCETTNCIAGWSVTIHPDGKEMEQKCGWWLAGRFLLGDKAASHFYDSQEDGLKYLQSV